MGWNARNASSGGEPLSAPPYATECAMTLSGNNAGEAQGYKIITLVLKDLIEFKKVVMRFHFTNIDDILLA